MNAPQSAWISLAVDWSATSAHIYLGGSTAQIAADPQQPQAATAVPITTTEEIAALAVDWHDPGQRLVGGSAYTITANTAPQQLARNVIDPIVSLAIDWDAGHQLVGGSTYTLEPDARIVRFSVPAGLGSVLVTGYAPSFPVPAAVVKVTGHAPFLAPPVTLVTGGDGPSLALDWSDAGGLQLGGSDYALWPNARFFRIAGIIVTGYPPTIPTWTPTASILVSGQIPHLPPTPPKGTVLVLGYAPGVPVAFPTGRVLVTGYAPGFTGPSTIRVTSIGLEGTLNPVPTVRITSIGLEGTLDPIPTARVTSFGLEIISSGRISTAQAYTDGAVPSFGNFSH